MILLASATTLFIVPVNIYKRSTRISEDMEKTMNPYKPDPGKTAAKSYEKPEGVPEVKAGLYLERIEDFDMVNSQWTYEIFLWFVWKSDQIDFLNLFDTERNQMLPVSIINGEILSWDVVEKVDNYNGMSYIQYRIIAKNTQFFDVTLFPVDKHDLIIAIEHNTLNRNDLIFVPDSIDSKVSSRVNINGYNTNKIKIIEKTHAYKSPRGNPKLNSGYKVDFSQLRFALSIDRDGLGYFLKLFLVLFVAVAVAFLAEFASRPDEFLVGSLFAAVGSSFIFTAQLPDTSIITLAEIINICGIVIILIIMIKDTMVRRIVRADGIVDDQEKKYVRLIRATLIGFFLTFNAIIIITAIIASY